MSLYTHLINMYDNLQDEVGIYHEDEKTPLLPIAHGLENGKIEITLQADGRFKSARQMAKEEPKVIVPDTEETEFRGGTSAAFKPRPLCDKIQFLTNEPFLPPSKDPEKQEKDHQFYLKQLEGYKIYLNQLKAWIDSEYTHPFLEPIYKYVSNGTIVSDLKTCEIKPVKTDLVCFRVEGIEGEEAACYKNRHLMQVFTNYYLSQKAEGQKTDCMVTGEHIPVAGQYSIISRDYFGTAKLLSCNDTQNFTYRGPDCQVSTSGNGALRAEQAFTAGYVPLQKAFKMLRWLIENKSYTCGTRTFICFSTTDKNHPNIKDVISTPFYRDEENKPVNDVDEIYDYYREDLKSIGYHDPIIFASFENIVNPDNRRGRVAITDYIETNKKDFIKHLKRWDQMCSTTDQYQYLFCPSLTQIALYESGSERKERVVTNAQWMKFNLKRLLECKISGTKIPVDLVKRLVSQASHLSTWTSQSNKEDSKYNNRKQLLKITCAVLRKYQYDYEGEDRGMAFNKDLKNRSYQFGRALAVYDWVETKALNEESKRRQENNKRNTKVRTSFAMKMQAAFVKRPMTISTQINDYLIARGYMDKLEMDDRMYCENLLGDISGKLLDCSEKQDDTPLDSMYLLGYWGQLKHLNGVSYVKSKTDDVKGKSAK